VYSDALGGDHPPLPTLQVGWALVLGRVAQIIEGKHILEDRVDPAVVRSTSRNLPSTSMKSYQQFSLFFVLAVLAGGAAAQAQSQADGRFNRVTTTGGGRASTSTSSQVRSVARSAGIGAAGGPSARTGSLRPPSSQAQARIQGQSDGTPQSSTWRQVSEPAVAPPVVTESRSHNYYPGMRPSLAIQRPVTLTARATGIPHICTPSRSMMVGAGHHGR
jgi:hypothetical protein